MGTQAQLRHVRTRVRPRYALLPQEGYVTSVLPHWTGAEARILASPALGAQFAQYLIGLQAGGGHAHEADEQTEAFFFVLSGAVTLTLDEGRAPRLGAGGYALVPHTTSYELKADGPASLLLLRKRYEPADGVLPPEPVVGHEADVPAEVWMDIEGARLQTLIPDDVRYDLAMNVFSFEPGYSLPIVETHVMEHGLYFLQGKGLYYLDEEWMEVEATDFIWMGPYVPQSFYATGTTPAKYLYYKNVNRDVPL
jgi:(S)-ureidoglycine aminohydrolase